MVWWNDKHPGVPLRDLAGVMGLAVNCSACGRVARVRREAALRIWGPEARTREIARSLRCTGCGERKAVVQVLVDVRPPDAIARDPDGGWATGPDYPEIVPPACPWCKRRKQPKPLVW